MVPMEIKPSGKFEKKKDFIYELGTCGSDQVAEPPRLAGFKISGDKLTPLVGSPMADGTTATSWTLSVSETVYQKKHIQ